MYTTTPFHHKNAGFSAIELLITLFVAAAFIVTGYQLFNTIITDGGDTRAESRAGNVAYEHLRNYSDRAANPCSAATPLVESPVTVEGLSAVTISVTISCPTVDASAVSKVEVVVAYNSNKSVRQATYIDKSKGTTATTIKSLVSWWKPHNGENYA